jgi:hypothetical protein
LTEKIDSAYNLRAKEDYSMKRIMIMLAIFALAAAALTGCAAPKVYKLGTGSFSEISGRTAVTGTDGRIQVTTEYATVLIDKDGKIVYINIDSAQNQGTFNLLGVIVKAEVAPTKKEKGDAYGMKAASPIKKEWFEQIAALETYFTGKTIDEILAMKLTEEAPDDLKTSVTIGITAFQQAVKKAVANAVEVKGLKSVGSASFTDMTSRNAVVGTDGRVQSNVTFAGVALDKNGKVLFVALDTAQNSGTFDTSGVVVKAEVVLTKKEKGDAYGMKAASGIKKEWFQQIASLETYFTGKTSAEIMAIPTTEEIPTGEDLKTSVTIGITPFQEAVKKAIANAVVIK